MWNGPADRSRRRAQGELEFCPACKTTDLYIQKDFPQGLGLFIVLVGIAISTVFWYYEMPISAYIVLIISLALDFLMYHVVPDVTICYRCLSQFRGAGPIRRAASSHLIWRRASDTGRREFASRRFVSGAIERNDGLRAGSRRNALSLSFEREVTRQPWTNPGLESMTI